MKGHCWSWVALWEFALLRIPELRAVAATDATGADVTLITTRGAGELPAEVKAWIEMWLAQKREVRDHQSTLAVLFDAPSDKVGGPALAQFAYLQRVARKANMDFFASTFDQPGETTGFAGLQIAERPPGTTSRMVMLKESQSL
jgi:hypothetical protein